MSPPEIHIKTIAFYYINDIVNSSELANFIMFADYTNLFFKHKDLTKLFSIINAELSKILYWFKLNKLSLNIKKTNYIIFKYQHEIN